MYDKIESDSRRWYLPSLGLVHFVADIAETKQYFHYS